jgi:hypothetical protein
MDGQSILRMFSITAQPGVTTENLFVIFGNGGRVLVYQGEYPGSSTWSLVAKYDMPAPVSNVGFLEIDSDIFVAAQDYCYWFRDLFLQGAQSAYQNSPSRPIENIWQDAYFVGTVSLPEASYVWYDKNLDAIITQVAEKTTGATDFGDIAEYQNEAIWFVYFRKYKAWAVWYTTFFYHPVLELNGVYYGTSNAYPDIVKLQYDRLVDQYAGTTEIPILTSWKTPYFAGFDQGTQKVNGVRLFFDETITGESETTVEKTRLIFDYSDFNAVLGWWTQSSVTDVPPQTYADSQITLPVNTSGQYNAFIGVGGVGGRVSVQVNQTNPGTDTASTKQGIYGACAYIEDGGELW